MAKRHSEGIICYGGVRPSFYGQTFTWDNSRPELDSSGVEDRSTFIEKGPMSGKIGWNGFTSDQYERDLFTLISGDSNSKPYSLLWGARPIPGDPAYFSTGQIHTGNRDFDRGKMAMFKADLVADSELYTGVTMYNPLFGAGLGVGTVLTPPQQLGAVPAGSRLVSNLHITNPPGVAGTTVIITATLQSAVLVGFGAPVDRVVINFTVSGTTVPDGKEVIVDGDSTPVTDTFWAWKFVISGVGPILFPVAVGGVNLKNT